MGTPLLLPGAFEQQHRSTMPWKVGTLGTKFKTDKPDVIESYATAELWSKGTVLKMTTKSKTSDPMMDASINYKMKKPFTLDATYDVKPKTTTLKTEVPVSKASFKISQVVPGNKWSVVPSPKIEGSLACGSKFEPSMYWDLSKRSGGATIKSKPSKKYELSAGAVVDSSFKPKELTGEFEYKPGSKWCDELDFEYSTVSGPSLQWEAKPTKALKADIKAVLKKKTLSANLEYKNSSKKPMVKTVLSLSAPYDKPMNYKASATVNMEYGF